MTDSSINYKYLKSCSLSLEVGQKNANLELIEEILVASASYTKGTEFRALSVKFLFSDGRARF